MTTRFASLLEHVSDPRAIAVGDWTIAQCASHVGVISHLDRAAATMQFPPEYAEVMGRALEARVADVAPMNALALEQRHDHDLRTIAREIEANVAHLLAETAQADPSETRVWLGSMHLPLSAVVTHYLFELIVHGGDIATGARLGWGVPMDAALAAWEGFALPFLASEGAARFIGIEQRPDVKAVCEFRVEGTDPLLILVEDGRIQLAPAGSREVDARLSADPLALLLVLFGRMSPATAVRKRRVIPWGKRPWKLVQVLRVLEMP
jgi:hypothetical protein